ncbi:MAG: H-X9-DG-CTERM domain-containing protein [Armatimonadota bacterium]|jgi:prepilin-type processing-associated H-X9-DG protein
MFQTQPYIMNAGIHDCPSASHTSSITSYLGHRSYGYNTRVFATGETPSARKLAVIRRPADIVMMGDVCHDRNATFRFHPPSSGPFMCDPDGTNCQVCGGTHNSLYANPLGSHASQYDRPGFNFIERHNGTGNVGFCDGHAKAMKHTELYQNGNIHPYFNYEA